ncbi:hypothetical protein AMTR_s03490p00005860 [Amborella trichopoda]|uniref:DUF4283 domain-containing protein n=1 Tax=Amborella trichopoda TaxID=13333 RepID=U5CY47_AMBTC|nr:hypothetical protein AMTR_s03490p00005860 [Amborella trichopoda]
MELSLIGMLSGPRPNWTLLQGSLIRRWAAKGDFDIIPKGPGAFLIRFSNREDMEAALLVGPCFIAGKCLVLKR